MPLYVALVYENHETAIRDDSTPDFIGYMNRYVEFGSDAGTAIVGGAILMPDYTATTIEVQGGRHGKVVLTDGPYVETKEMLGGFYLLEAQDLDEAIAIASQIPAAWDGGRIEVRPTMTRSS
jgi:hypothetical protein